MKYVGHEEGMWGSGISGEHLGWGGIKVGNARFKNVLKFVLDLVLGGGGG